jgi:hypothetical protein
MFGELVRVLRLVNTCFPDAISRSDVYGVKGRYAAPRSAGPSASRACGQVSTPALNNSFESRAVISFTPSVIRPTNRPNISTIFLVRMKDRRSLRSQMTPNPGRLSMASGRAAEPSFHRPDTGASRMPFCLWAVSAVAETSNRPCAGQPKAALAKTRSLD